MAIINPNRPTVLDVVRQADAAAREEGRPTFLEKAYPEILERSRINMPSNSNDRQPDLPMSLPVARGPLRERAAVMICPYCKEPLHMAEDRENGFHMATCEVDAVDPGI